MIPAVMEPMRPIPPIDRSIDAARRGEARGFDELFRALGGPVTGFARARGAADPEGICNEAFLRAFQNLGSFKGDGAAFRRWIFSITRNLVIDAFRAARRRPQEVFTDPPNQWAPAAENEALARLGNAEVARMLDVLTDEQREVIVLRLVADLSLAETADIVGRRVTAVKRLQARALRRLQSALLDEGVSS
ncbi:MAG: RNA polymerase sigma-70 factor (ECF subfamily) [Candidatus Aldehydirespiratoraceae bacterium]|jgi:RNA polymerase sigma-70 factor (ECF subfamily)